AAIVPAGGSISVSPPAAGEDLFLYVTDGSGETAYDGEPFALGQYDVILARPSMRDARLRGGAAGLSFLSFYLPAFL
ncbi:MAG TPA: hypothetical protein VER79_08470, partial [Candidatus Limnocylindrales bacterium]|nr:hypothetical protein [Candidatus Limnocylindrales bacterium]